MTINNLEYRFTDLLIVRSAVIALCPPVKVKRQLNKAHCQRLLHD